MLRKWGTFIDCLRLGFQYLEIWGFPHVIKAKFENLSKTRKLPYLSQLVEIKKIKALSFLELLKFKEAKCL